MTLVDDELNAAITELHLTDVYRKQNPNGTYAGTHTGKAEAHIKKAQDYLKVVPPTTSKLGANVGNAPAPLTGTVLRVTTARELLDAVDAIKNAPQGQVIDCGGIKINLSGGTVYLPPISVRSEIRNGGVVGGGLDSNIRAAGSAAKWTLRSFSSEKSKADGFKLTDDALDIYLVDVLAQENGANGFLTTQRAHGWKMWNVKSIKNGTNGNLDQNWYIGSMRDDCLIANFYGESPSGYNLQLQYSQCFGGLITCGELVGGTTSRGAVVASYGSSKVKVVGLYAHDMPMSAYHVLDDDPSYAKVSGMIVTDSYEERTGGWAPEGGVTYTRIHSGPAGPIDSSEWGNVPMYDANYVLRPTPPRAGSKA